MDTNNGEKLRALVLAPCDFDLDPRHSYWSEQLLHADFEVLELEVISSPRRWTHKREIFVSENRISVFADAGLAVQNLPPRFSWLCGETKSSTGMFLAARTLKQLNAVDWDLLRETRPDLIIANDLSGAIMADFLWGDTDTAIVYDAQEVFTDSYDLLPGEPFSNVERLSWMEAETALCNRVAAVVTVSPGLSNLYQNRHNVDAYVMPNFVPKNRQLKSFGKHGPIRFVFIGRAEPHRGLENLIQSWDCQSEIASLDLIIPENSHKKNLTKLNKQLSRKFCGPRICKAVPVNQLVETLAQYDVGILPYAYPYPYSEASPNKLGEYLAAGLAILTSDQRFVSEVVAEYKLGAVYSWDNKGSFAESVEKLKNRAEVESFKEAVIEARTKYLNFDLGFDGLLQLLNLSIQSRPNSLRNLEIDSVERNNLPIALWRNLKRILQRIAIRNLRFLGPMIKAFGSTRLGRGLAK